MIQIVLIGILIVYGIVCLRIEPFRYDAKKMATSALLLVITLIVKRMAVLVPLFGVESMKITLEYIPMMIAGYAVGLSYGYFVGVASDLLGLIVYPTGYPFFGFTINCVLVVTIGAFTQKYAKNINAYALKRFTCAALVLFLLGGSAYVLSLESISVSGTAYALSPLAKGALIGTMGALSLVFIYFLMKKQKQMFGCDDHLFAMWLLSVLITEVIVTLTLMPLWLQIMYGIPYLVSFSLRLVKSCFMIPAYVLIGYPLLRALKNRF